MVAAGAGFWLLSPQGQDMDPGQKKLAPNQWLSWRWSFPEAQWDPAEADDAFRQAVLADGGKTPIIGSSNTGNRLSKMPTSSPSASPRPALRACARRRCHSVSASCFARCFPRARRSGRRFRPLLPRYMGRRMATPTSSVAQADRSAIELGTLWRTRETYNIVDRASTFLHGSFEEFNSGFL